jgi:hypothetical protein
VLLGNMQSKTMSNYRNTTKELPRENLENVDATVVFSTTIAMMILTGTTRMRRPGAGCTKSLDASGMRCLR